MHVFKSWTHKTASHVHWESFGVYDSRVGVIQFNSIQFNSIQSNPIHNPIQSLIQSNPIQSNPIQFNSIQFNSIQFNLIRFDSIQCNSIRFDSFDSIRFISIRFNLFWLSCVFYRRRIRCECEVRPIRRRDRPVQHHELSAEPSYPQIRIREYRSVELRPNHELERARDVDGWDVRRPNIAVQPAVRDGPDQARAGQQQGDACCWVCTSCDPSEIVQDEYTCEQCESRLVALAGQGPMCSARGPVHAVGESVCPVVRVSRSPG